MTLTFILLTIIVIGFNIWNIININGIKKDATKTYVLNDAKYWELKYKIQYLITATSIILFVAAYLGYQSVRDVKNDLKNEFQSSLDSSKRDLSRIFETQKILNSKMAAADSSILQAEDAILGLMGREKNLSGSLSMSKSNLSQLMERITEINSKNILQQNIYIVDNVPYSIDQYWEFKKYYFKDLTSNTGQPLPLFNKPPFIFSVSNQGFTFALRKITKDSFEMSVSAASDPELNDAKSFFATLFITEKP